MSAEMEEAGLVIASFVKLAHAIGATPAEIGARLEELYLNAGGQYRAIWAPDVAAAMLAELHASVERHLGGVGLATLPTLGSA